ncbi:MAG: protein-tyrosine phosphatase family protein [Beijerinckiaceae bacterium]
MSEPFSIATLILPSGGSIGIAPLPGRGGDLAADIAMIQAWGADHVVTMTPLVEMESAGVGALGDLLIKAGAGWHKLPVVDYGVPDAEVTAEWIRLAPMLQATLNTGGKVLLHCMGGKGRSGMVALRLLVERGENPATALARIRAVRPGAVETEAQLEWAIDAQTKPTTDLGR